MAIPNQFSPLQFLLIDDHDQFRAGLSNILRTEFPNATLFEAANGKDGLQLAVTNNPDIILLDLSMPGIPGTKVLDTLVKQGSGKPVIIVSIHPEDQFSESLLNAGAKGYLNKEMVPENLAQAIKAVMSGHIFTSSTTDRPTSQHNDNPKEKILSELSTRESIILELISAGKDEQYICKATGISAAAFNAYNQMLLKKLGIASNAELALIAERPGPTLH